MLAGLVVSVAPLVLLIANRDWFFTPEGFLDPWQYVGFFRFYEDLDYSPEEYKLARLPWILAGYGITRSMPTMPAAYLLHAIFLCALPLTFFGATYSMLRKTSLAAILALCLGFYTHAHGSGGWDYHNTASGPLFLGTLWVTVLPSSRRGAPGALMLAGVMVALTLHTNITLVNFLPALFYLHLVASRLENHQWPSRSMLLGRIGWSVVGALLATTVLGTINWIVGRDFLFFESLLRKVTRFLTGSPDISGLPLLGAWVLGTGYLGLLAATMVSGIGFLALERRKTGDDREMPRALSRQFLGAALLWIVGQFLGQPVLDWDTMAHPLIASCFLALAGLLSRGWPESVERRPALVIVLTALVLTSCLVATLPPVSTVAALAAPGIGLVAAVVFVAPIAVYLWRPSAATVCLFVAVFALGNRLVAGSPQNYAADDRCKVQPAVYQAIVDATSRLVSIDPMYYRVRIWFGENEVIYPAPQCGVSLGWMGYSIRSMSSMNYLTKPHPMPEVDDVPEDSIRQMRDSDAILT
ncbi:MAG TPA: hypothetical protein VFO67_05780, partial [Gemmatimonadales bacterium]|nr:hypothetical protein [Gemmatimonadales bacterium]